VTKTKRSGGKGTGSKPQSGQPRRVKPKQVKRIATTGRTAGRFPVRGDLKNARKPVRRPAADKVRPLPLVAAHAPIAANNGRDIEELRALALELMNGALDKKALMPVLIDVSGMASYTDFIGIVSGRSDRQVDAIADHIVALMKARGRYVIGQEGSGNGRWTLLDFGSIVVHVFYHPVREFYDLESLWIDAPRVKLAVPPEAMITQPDALYGAL
jgi:ribosome-associated protein